MLTVVCTFASFLFILHLSKLTFYLTLKGDQNIFKKNYENDKNKIIMEKTQTTSL